MNTMELIDEGTMETAYRCRVCGHVERYQEQAGVMQAHEDHAEDSAQAGKGLCENCLCNKCGKRLTSNRSDCTDPRGYCPTHGANHGG
jgi:hypothetical protein